MRKFRLSNMYFSFLRLTFILTEQRNCEILKLLQINNPYGKNRGAAHGLHVGNGVGCPWAAYGNFVMHIRLPTTFIYGYSGQLSGQLSGQPTTFKY